jgi:hypothetical protein
MTILPKIHHNSDGTHIEEPLRRQEQAEDAKAPYSKAEEVLLFSKLVVGPHGTSGIYRDVTIYSPAIKHGWLIHHLRICPFAPGDKHEFTISFDVALA